MEIYKILEKLDNYEEITFDEIVYLAKYTFDLNEFDWSYLCGLRDFVWEYLDEHGEDWVDRDEDYPTNPYHVGYILHEEIFITGYTGVAGHYWDNRNEYTICRP